MTKAKRGDTVTVHFTGKLNDGSIFDTSYDEEPIEFTLGAEDLLPAFEDAVIGMEVGEKKTISIPCEEAYGQRDEDLVFEVSREEFPSEIEPQPGDELELIPDESDEDVETDEDEEAVPVIVVDVTDTMVVLDANHPLADEDLIFEIELVSVS